MQDITYFISFYMGVMMTIFMLWCGDIWGFDHSNIKAPPDRVIADTYKRRKKTKDGENPEIQQLSNKNHKLRRDIEACKYPEQRRDLKIERKETKKQIQQKLKEHENAMLEDSLTRLEETKDDSNRYYQVLREINNKKSKQPLCVNDEDGNIASTEKQQAEIITRHFQRMLAPEDAEPNNKSYPPHPMTSPFTACEIRKAALSMKNGKSCGIDEVRAEHVKYAPLEIHNSIADIFNNTASEGNPPSEIQIGILSPIPKPGKKRGPPENLRPIILLSIRRKIMTICIMRRCCDRLKSRISKDQAAYQGGRSTTEQVFAIKLLAEKAICSSNYKIYILMLDMSKAFDTVHRNKLFEGLEEILLPEELHLLHLLTNNVKLKVRTGNEYGPDFTTLKGIMQGDCLSAVLFIFYLAMALSDRPQPLQEHNY